MQYDNTIYRNFDVLRNFRVQLESILNLKTRSDSSRVGFKKKRNRPDSNRVLKLNSKIRIGFKS